MTTQPQSTQQPLPRLVHFRHALLPILFLGSLVTYGLILRPHVLDLPAPIYKPFKRSESLFLQWSRRGANPLAK